MGNVCGGAKALDDSPTHHRLGSASEPARRPQAPGAAPKPSRASRPARSQPANSTEERERRAQAAEERAKAAAARGTVASNPKRGHLASKVSEPVSKTNRTEDRDELPLRWD